MRVHLSRFICLDVASNLIRFELEAHQAAAAGADLVVFPEAFLHGYTRTVEPALVRGIFERISSDHPATAFLFGSITEERRNRLTVWRGGRELGHYDKVHLFAPHGEHELWDPGDRYAAVRVLDWTLGLITCSDIRFPEQARALRLRTGCEALVVIGWWPWRRDHVWETLLRARAMENGVFTLGCSVAASEFPGEVFAGAGNHVFDPLGEPLQTADDRTFHLDRERLEEVLVDPLRSSVDIQEVAVF
nr:nitrilase-related carbon-nitrogen hydrolase [uncultured Holophaga sp.]